MLMQLDFWHYIGKNISQYGKKCVKYQKLLARFRHLMDGLDIYLSRFTSHTIIPPGKLAELLGQCKNGIDRTF